MSHRFVACITALALSTSWAEEPAPAPSQQIIRSGSISSASGATEFFTGRVRVDPVYAANADINASGALVTFEPGARSNWHTHPKGQYLVVTAGAGLIQEWGQPVQQIHPGDIVWCPPGVKHWHGAAATTAMDAPCRYWNRRRQERELDGARFG